MQNKCVTQLLFDVDSQIIPHFKAKELLYVVVIWMRKSNFYKCSEKNN